VSRAAFCVCHAAVHWGFAKPGKTPPGNILPDLARQQQICCAATLDNIAGTMLFSEVRDARDCWREIANWAEKHL
jgi:hypothetical protein